MTTGYEREAYANLERAAKALEQIARVLERAFPVEPEPVVEPLAMPVVGCRVTRAGRQCEFPAGHVMPHRSGTLEWSNQDR